MRAGAQQPTAASRWPAMLILGIAALSTSTLRSARLFLIEQSLCRSYFETYDPVLIRPDGSVDEFRCKSDAMQADVSLVSGIFEVVTLICGLVAAPAYTRLAPRLGKRRILLLNLCGMTAAAFYSTAVCFFHGFFDIRMMWLAGLFEFVGGGQPVRNALLYAYLAEVVQGSVLSESFYQLSTLQLAMNFLGTTLGAALLGVDVWLLSLLGAAVGALAIPLVVFLAPSSYFVKESETLCHPEPPLYGALPADEEAHNLLSAHGADEDEDQEDDKWTTSLAWARTSRAAQKVADHSFGLLRDLSRDPLMRVTLLMYLCDEMAIFVRVNFPQWATKRFGYTLAEANAITSFSILVNGAVLVAVPVLSSRVLRPLLGTQRAVDFWITRTSLIFNIVGILCIGVSPLGGFHIFSLAIYSLGSALTDSLRSCVTTALEGEEGSVRKLYTGISMIENVAGLSGTTLWSVMFSVGIRYGGTALGGIPFFAAAGLFGVALSLTRPLKKNIAARRPITAGGEETE